MSYTEMMKIATNVHRDAFGGITISNLALFDWLEEKDDIIVGIEYMATRRFFAALIFRRYLPSFFRHHIISCEDILRRYPWGTTWWLKQRWRPLIEEAKRVLQAEKPDIILINGTYHAPWIMAQAAQELGVPIVLRYAGVLQYEVAHSRAVIRRRLLHYERYIVSQARAIIFPSTLCQQVVEQEILKQPARRATVIPNPAKPPPLLGRRRSHRRFTLAAIGRWTPIKNFPAFVAAHQQLLTEGFAHRAILVTSHMERSTQIPETIERQVSMSQEDLQLFYRSVDLVVVPSHFETFCNVAAEAVVRGAAVLVSERVGFAEVLKSCGLERMVIDSFDDPVAVAAAIRYLTHTPLTRAERLRVTAALDPHAIHQDILSVLENVLAES
jgi:glycosyltransferase involved in cell wall biosynthesis